MADEEKDQNAKPKGERARPEGGQARGQETAAAPRKRQRKPTAEAKPREPEPKMPARLRLRYEQEIVPTLMRELKIENPMRVPRLDKIVINMALGEARDNVKILDAAVEEIKRDDGPEAGDDQARARRFRISSCAKGMPIGVMVTLRRERM